jgi:transcriptional regulator GlxA family with amidase domain
MIHEVAVLALPGAVVLDLGTPTQVFHAARAADDSPNYRVRVASPDGGPVPTSAGFAVLPEYDLSLLDGADTVIVPGAADAHRLPPTAEPVLAALRAAYARGARVMSICTGAFVLAEAGLLDGRPATTHWAHADAFRRAYPRVLLDPDVLFVDDGQVLTSAGVAAGLDLCLHVVRRDHGSEVANRAARRVVVPAWRDGGQAQFIERPVPPLGDASTSGARAWALQRLEHPIDLPELAAQARMSVRTFVRRFRDETGQSPGRWLRQQRIEQARRLLESTDLTVDAVAARVGYSNAVSLRQHLHAVVGVSPAAYRRAFRAQAQPESVPSSV